MSARRAPAPEAELERCPECGLPPGEGRYGWGGGTPGGHAERCATCGRVHDEFPVGSVLLAGEAFWKRRKEVIERLSTWAKLLAKEHPARRVEAIDPLHTGVLVRTNDARLAMRIAEALVRTYGGALEYRHSHSPAILHVTWTL